VDFDTNKLIAAIFSEAGYAAPYIVQGNRTA